MTSEEKKQRVAMVSEVIVVALRNAFNGDVTDGETAAGSKMLRLQLPVGAINIVITPARS